MNDFEHRQVAFIAGWGAGKTWAGARKLLNLHVLNAMDEGGQPTAVKGLVVAPTYQIASAVLVPELMQAMQSANLGFRYFSDHRRSCIVLTDLGSELRPSEILIRSAERPDRITGFEVGHIWGDEAGRWRQSPDDPMLDAMVQAEGRLRDPKAKFLQANYTFTHEGDCTSVYRRFEEEHDPEHPAYRAITTDNPIMREYADEQRRNLSPELASQYLDGKAISRRGSAVYSSFDESKNLDAGLQLSDSIPLHLSVDFNIDPGMHAIIGQHFPHEDLLTAVHEIHEPRMDVRSMVHAMKSLIERELGHWRWPSLHVFGDASGSGKWAGSGQSCWEILSEALRHASLPFKQFVPRSNPPVADRVNAFNCALNSLDNRTRYKIHPRCKLLIRDLKQMRWQQGELDKSDRHLSHAADAEGYRVHRLMPIQPIRMAKRTATIGFSG
jgi:hypothetical protein